MAGVLSGISWEKLYDNIGLAIFYNQILTYLFEIICSKSFLKNQIIWKKELIYY